MPSSGSHNAMLEPWAFGCDTLSFCLPVVSGHWRPHGRSAARLDAGEPHGLHSWALVTALRCLCTTLNALITLLIRPLFFVDCPFELTIYLLHTRGVRDEDNDSRVMDCTTRP